MQRRLALNTKGDITYCTAKPEDVGKGRCNHIDHQRLNETNIQFMEHINEKPIKHNDNLDNYVQNNHPKLKKFKRLFGKVIAPGLSVAAAILILTGCSSKDVNRIAKEGYYTARTVQRIKRHSNYRNNNTSQWKSDSKGYTGSNQSIKSMIKKIKVQPLQHVNYDRSTWGSNTPSFYYKLNGKTLYTSSSNRAAYYNSAYYNATNDTYKDPYTGKILHEYKGTGNGAVNFDHIIPLHYVQQAVGNTWNSSKKNKYAYDLTIGVDADARNNFIKGDKGPSQYLPPNREGAIKYCYSWLDIASRYNIPIAPEDMKMIKSVLSKAKPNELKIINPYKSGVPLNGTR